MSRVYFRRRPTLRERFEALSAPGSVRRATLVAQKVTFDPIVPENIRQRVVEKLRTETDHYSGVMREFESADALAVLAFMDTFREAVTELDASLKSTPAAYSLRATLRERERHLYRSTLATCALYLRRSGHLNRETMSKRLYRAAEYIETFYPSVNERPTV